MPHIHTQPGEHDHTVSAFIIRTDGPEPRLLLHRHKRLNKYMQIGGHVELNETPWQAITHELLEESGYDISQLRILQPAVRVTALDEGVSLHPYPVATNTHPIMLEPLHYHTDTAYALVTDEEPRHPIGDDESTDIRLISCAELDALSDDDIYKNVRTLAQFVLDECLKNWEQIPTSEFA